MQGGRWSLLALPGYSEGVPGRTTFRMASGVPASDNWGATVRLLVLDPVEVWDDDGRQMYPVPCRNLSHLL
jgi:hypothetical protein